MKKINHPLLLSVTLLTLLATTAWGAPEIRIIGQEPVYEVRGEELPGVGALDVTVGYDANGLKNPRVTQQQLSAGAILIPYFPTPGVVRVVILAPQGITGSGVLFRTAFDSLSGSAGKIISINAKMVSAASQGDVPVQTSIFVTPLPVSAVNQPAAPGGNLTDTSTSTSTSTSPLSGDTAQNSSPFAALKAALTGQAVVPPTSSGAATIAVVTPLTVSGAVGNPSSEQPPGGGGEDRASGSGPVAGGDESAPAPPDSPVLPAEGSDLSESSSRGDLAAQLLPAARQSGADTAVGNEALIRGAAKPPLSPVVKPKVTAQVSVLALFREYRGARTPAALSALFSLGSIPGVSQTPPIAISDGVAALTVAVERDSSNSPNFSVSGGKLVSLKREGKRYLLNIIPYARTVEVTLSLLVGNTTTVIPLVVVPPLDNNTFPSGKLDEATFSLLLKKSGGASGTVPGDVTGDYQDDYILTAHYLLQKNKK